MKKERMVGISRIMWMPCLCLLPANDFTQVFNNDFTCGNVAQSIHTLAMNTRAADLDAASAMRDSDWWFFRHSIKIWYRELVWVRVCAREKTGL